MQLFLCDFFFITLRALFAIGFLVMFAAVWGCLQCYLGVCLLGVMVGVLLFAFVVSLFLLVCFAFDWCGVGFMLGRICLWALLRCVLALVVNCDVYD